MENESTSLNSVIDTPESVAVSSPPPSDAFAGLVGNSPEMRKIFRLVERVADSDSTILIQGETGTGKGMIAKAIHRRSYRREKPFVAINCGAIPENLLESELFGHIKGAFTGATANKTGKFETADGGTVFLDEIGDMSADLQVKILKVLEERQFEPVGGCRSLHVDIRIIAATHRNLEEAVKTGNFREDLFYRLYVIPITLPALRERFSDIPHFVSHFIHSLNHRKRTHIDRISDAALGAMMRYAWPGNVREMANLMERLMVIKGEGRIELHDLPEKFRSLPSAFKTGLSAKVPETRRFGETGLNCDEKQMIARGGADAADAEDQTVSEPVLGVAAIPMAGMASLPDIPEAGISLTDVVSRYEKAWIVAALKKSGGVKNKAAKLLQVKRTTLVEKIKRYELENDS